MKKTLINLRERKLLMFLFWGFWPR